MRNAILGTVAGLSAIVAVWVGGGPGLAAGGVGETIARYAYSPNPLEVSAGQIVTWTNLDEAPHTVTSSSGPEPLASPQLSRGQSWAFRFTRPGTYRYFCAVHPTMRAVLVVVPLTSARPPTLTPGPVRAASLAPPPIATPPLMTTTVTTSPGGVHINPLLFLLAVVAGVGVFCVLAIVSGARDMT